MTAQTKTTWRKMKLDERDGLSLIIDHRGITPKKLGGNWDSVGIPALSAKNIKNGQIINQAGIRYVSQKLYDRWMREKLRPGDVLLTSEAPLGELYFLKEKKDYCLSQRLFALRANPNILNPNYLYYFLKSVKGQHELMRRISGTAAQGIRQAELRKIEISAPVDILEQHRIVSALSAFDDKIELNNKISKNLEQTAQAIFNEWFVNFKFFGHEKVKMVDSKLGKIPEGWKVKKFGELLKLKHGHGFKSEEFGEERTNRILVRMGNFKETGGLQFDDNTKYLKSDTYNKKDQLLPNDLVMVLSDITRDGRIIGRVGLIPKDERVYLLNQRVAKIEMEEKFKLFLFFYFNSKKFKEHCLSRADSATVLNLKNDHIYEIKMAIPEDNILDEFNGLVLPVFKKSREIENENQKLTALRDLLLPKLMSGEIKV